MELCIESVLQVFGKSTDISFKLLPNGQYPPKLPIVSISLLNYQKMSMSLSRPTKIQK